MIANCFEYFNPMTWENGDADTVNVDLVVTSRVTVAESVRPAPVPDIVSVYSFVDVELVVEMTRIAYPDPSAGGVTVLGVKTAEIELGRLAWLSTCSFTGASKPPVEDTRTVKAVGMPGAIVCLLG
ncbi:hypothetical protein [[Eubacterium] cellulosolvens]